MLVIKCRAVRCRCDRSRGRSVVWYENALQLRAFAISSPRDVRPDVYGFKNRIVVWALTPGPGCRRLNGGKKTY